MAAAAAGADVDTAAHTADNAARNNALDTIWDGLCILYDSGKIAYGLYKDDKGMVREGFIDLASDTAAFFIPMVPAGMTKLAKSEGIKGAVKAGGLAGKVAQDAVIGGTVQAGVGTALYGGDLGQNLGSMLTEEGMRSLLASMVLAGEMSKFGSTFANKNLYTAEQRVLATTLVKTLTSNVVGGQDMEKAFLTALGSSFDSYVMGKLDADKMNEVQRLVLLGAVGAAGAKITGGDPVQAAMSSMVSEMANWVKATPITAAQKAEKEKYGAMSDCAYGDACAIEKGFNRVTAEGMKQFLVEKADWSEKEVQDVEKLMNLKSGLHFDVYFKEGGSSGKGEVVVAIRGTELTDMKDLATNIKQAFGSVGQEYKDAADKNVLRALSAYATSNNADMNVTGHSLGGGIATALASTGYFDKAIVFNAAALHQNTIAAIGGSSERADKLTTNYDSRGDLLDLVQTAILSPITGVRKYGQVVTSDGDGLHGVSSMYHAPVK